LDYQANRLELGIQYSLLVRCIITDNPSFSTYTKHHNFTQFQYFTG